MYCIKCGVELAEGELRCPLCGTHVYHPDFDNSSPNRPYPSTDKPVESVTRSGLMFILTVLFAIPLIITLLCDLRINSAITWSGYAAGAILMVYTILMLPIWFNKPNPVIFAPIDFAAIALFLCYINYQTGGHWFWTLALPITAAVAVIVTTPITLMRYVRRGRVYIAGGIFIALGALCVLIELLVDVTFNYSITLWSIYPLIAGFLIGMSLIVIAIVKPWREALRRKFFI